MVSTVVRSSGAERSRRYGSSPFPPPSAFRSRSCTVDRTGQLHEASRLRSEQSPVTSPETDSLLSTQRRRCSPAEHPVAFTSPSEDLCKTHTGPFVAKMLVERVDVRKTCVTRDLQQAAAGASE